MYNDEGDPEKDYFEEYRRQHPEYYQPRQSISRPIRNRGRTNAIAVIGLCLTAVMLIAAGLVAYLAFKDSMVTSTDAALSSDQIVGTYNAEHGMTVYGETLTPGGVDLTVEAYFASQGTTVPQESFPTAPSTPTPGGPTSQVSDFPWVSDLVVTTPNFGTPGMVCVDHFVQEKNCDPNGCYYVITDTMNARIPADEAFYNTLSVGQKMTTNCYYK